MINYFDVHTHNENIEDCVLSVFNYDPSTDSKLPDKRYYTVGIHPWSLSSKGSMYKVSDLKKYAEDPYCLGFGETGLDYAIKECRELQSLIFRKHIQVANELNIKCVIIHCVRAYSDIIKIIKEESYTGTLVFHDYNGNIEETRALMSLNSYFSFGRSLFRKSNKLISFDESLYSRILLETDEQNQYLISDIYLKAGGLLEFEEAKLASLIKSNFNNCFEAILGIS